MRSQYYKVSRIFVGWDRRGETQQMPGNVGFRSSTQPTSLRIFTQNLRSIACALTLKSKI
jgi:hypothetical protein